MSALGGLGDGHQDGRYPRTAAQGLRLSTVTSSSYPPGMKHSQTCPKCAHRRFAVIPKFDIPNQRSSNGTEDVPVVTVGTGWSRLERGHFEVWICERCGLTEWYAVNLHGLFDVAQQHPDDIRIVDGTARPST